MGDVIFLAEGGPELLVSAKKITKNWGSFSEKGSFPFFVSLLEHEWFLTPAGGSKRRLAQQEYELALEEGRLPEVERQKLQR